MAAESVKKEQITKPKRKKRTTKLTPKQDTIITLKKQNPTATATAIAKLANADISYTIEILQRYGLIAETVNDYKNNRADILAGMQARLLSSISQADIEKTPVGSRILAACQLFDKEKAELGQSTDKQPVLVLVRGDNCQVSVNDNKISMLQKAVENTGIEADGQVIDITHDNDNAA